MVRKNHESGFTLVETMAGLAVLVVLLIAIAVFSGPLFFQLPSFGNSVRTSAQVAELQNLLLRVGGQTHVPWWWPDAAVEITADTLSVHDLSGLNTTKNNDKPDLLKLVWIDGSLKIEMTSQSYDFQLDGPVSFTALRNDDGRLRGAQVTVGEGERAYVLLLPLFSAPLAGKDDHDLP